MDIEVPRHPRVDLLEEVEKLGRTMALVAFADDKTRGDVERREQRRCAVANVAVGAALGMPGIIGRIGCSRSSAWICDFSSTLSTSARLGGDK
jgi:hypothetical protein